MAIASVVSFAIVLLILYFVVDGIGKRRRFRERWPAISDEEFLEKCPQGTSLDTAIRVRRIVAKQLGIPYEHIHPEQSFARDLGCD